MLTTAILVAQLSVLSCTFTGPNHRTSVSYRLSCSQISLVTKTNQNVQKHVHTAKKSHDSATKTISSPFLPPTLTFPTLVTASNCGRIGAGLQAAAILPHHIKLSLSPPSTTLFLLYLLINTLVSQNPHSSISPTLHLKISA